LRKLIGESGLWLAGFEVQVTTMTGIGFHETLKIEDEGDHDCRLVVFRPVSSGFRRLTPAAMQSGISVCVVLRRVMSVVFVIAFGRVGLVLKPDFNEPSTLV